MTTFRRKAVRRALCAGTVLFSLAAATAGGFDIPTGGPRSPLFGAEPFTQPMPLFEEFGTKPIPTGDCPGCDLLPIPETCDDAPAGADLDNFLKQALWPLPQREANIADANPWAYKVGKCLGKTLGKSAIEGRPPGEWFAHQRADEFPAKVYFQSAQSQGRTNTGLRDGWQRHQFSTGEFAPGGLYYNGGTNKGIAPKLHPKMPAQLPNSVWTFDGTLPPKLLMARYGETVLFRHYNALPIGQASNGGFGRHTITTHQHNGHNPAESDGYPGAYFFPGQFYDYRWPLVLAGHDSENTDASDPRAATPDGRGGTYRIRGDWRNTMSTQWFHDHMLDHTAENVYKGNAAMMNIYSAVDRGREGFLCQADNPANVNLCLPSGTALDWGNRDYDVNLVVADKATDSTGQLFYDIFNRDGFLGDLMTVNWAYKPYLEVRARKYRFRILNGSVSRFIKIAIVNGQGQRVPFHLIANDGNIMEHAIAFPNAESRDLPAQGIGERYDIVIDFKAFAPGTKLYLVNVLEHKDGREPEDAIPLNEALGRYKGDPAVGKFMEFRVKDYYGTDKSMNPADYVEGKKKMIPLPMPTPAELATARHRTFEFGRSSGTDSQPWTIKTDGGQGYGADMHRVSAAPTKGSLEIWHFSTGGGWSHPVHVHFEEGLTLNRDGRKPPSWERLARKDIFRIGDAPDSTREMTIAIRFREFMGSYVEHCHNTLHEDHAQLLRWDIKNPGATITVPAPYPTWEGVYYESSYALNGK